MFNQAQISELISELITIRSTAGDASLVSNIDNLVQFLNASNGVDVFVKFEGD